MTIAAFAPQDWPHAVEADLPLGPAFQPCPCDETARALFDRLRRLRPGLILRRYAAGRVVETTRPVVAAHAGVDAAPD